MPSVFLQFKHGIPYHFSASIAAEGFRQLGYEIIPFDLGDLSTMRWSPEIPVFACVGAIKVALAALGFSPLIETYPKELLPFLNRSLDVTQLGRLSPGDLPLFIKPKLQHKRFTGFVCNDVLDRRLGGISPEFEIYVSNPVDILSEYRCYVLNGKILSIARYRGSVEHFPNVAIVREMICAYLDAPISYGLDVGITSKGETLLVEVNDSTSLGNYGLPPTLFAKMIAARWFQITGQDYSEEADCFDSPSFISN